MQLYVDILKFSAPGGACLPKYQFNSFFKGAQEKTHIFTNSLAILTCIKLKFVANLVIFLIGKRKTAIF